VLERVLVLAQVPALVLEPVWHSRQKSRHPPPQASMRLEIIF